MGHAESKEKKQMNRFKKMVQKNLEDRKHFGEVSVQGLIMQ